MYARYEYVPGRTPCQQMKLQYLPSCSFIDGWFSYNSNKLVTSMILYSSFIGLQLEKPSHMVTTVATVQ